MDEGADDSEVARVSDVLRQSIAELDWLEPLRLHTAKRVPESWAAIGFDSNALKKLRRYPADRRASLLTFLESRGVAVVLPAQAIQEFWNNHGVFAQDFQRVETETRKLANRYTKLSGGSSVKATLERFADEIRDLAADVGDSENEHLLEESVEFWDLLLPTSRVACMPRTSLLEIGEMRLACGVAPGFEDDRKPANWLGDFFVWADFLLGLAVLGLPPGDAPDSAVVFITDDRKDDWFSSGAPHPTLLGEVFAITGRPLQILGMDALSALAE